MQKLNKNVFLSLLIIFFAGSAYAAGNNAGMSEYEAGVHAFQAGDYTQALQHFETARRQGDESPNLTYNLAVTHYKLKQFDESERLFRELEGKLRYRDIAHYNLGLIAMQRGDADAAARWFKEIRRTSHNEKLRYLAGKGLRTLGRPVGTRAPVHYGKNWLTLLSAGGGYNDNPLAYPELQLAPANKGSDSFFEFLGYGQIYLYGHYRDGLLLHGFAYTKKYIDQSVVDVTTANVELTRENTFNGWRYMYGGGIGHSQVSGHTLTNQVQGDFSIERSVGDNTYRLRYQPYYHSAGNRYSYLGGWEHKLDLRWRRRWNNLRWTARYRFEYNSRDDLKTATTFLSFSPIRNSLRLQADWHAMPDLTLTAGGQFTHSEYSGKDQLTDIDGVFKVKKRKADKIQAWIRAEYELTPHWQVRAGYEYTKNDENLKLYKYQYNEVKALIEFEY
jgi:tetratricopeptide (TPR) repeat protein